MKKIRAAVVGYGKIGRFTVEALEAAADFEIAGIVRRSGANEKPLELTPYEVVSDIRELKAVDVAILATPTRNLPVRFCRWASTRSIPSTSTPTFAAIASG